MFRSFVDRRFLAVSRSDRVRGRIRTLALFEVPLRFTSFSSYLRNVRKEKMMTSALNVGRNLSFTARKCFTPKRASLLASFSTPLHISYSMLGLMWNKNERVLIARRELIIRRCYFHSVWGWKKMERKIGIKIERKRERKIIWKKAHPLRIIFHLVAIHIPE